MKSSRTTEGPFETVIEAQLLTNGYVAVDRASFDRERATFPETVRERTITLLKERSTALIAAAVTGKVNVQGEIA
jgi:hypothetical protein